MSPGLIVSHLLVIAAPSVLTANTTIARFPCIETPTAGKNVAPPDEAVAENGSIPGVTHMSLRVYLVEDSPIVFERLPASMHDEGATVVGHAEDAATAVAEIAALCPDVVVVDIALREGTGFHVLDAIGDLPEAERPARIVLTNFTRDWYRNAANRLGAEHFFDKSSQIPEMLDVLRAMSPRHATDARLL